jgi:microcin-processing metallopeptidase PmbA/TldD-like protein
MSAARLAGALLWLGARAAGAQGQTAQDPVSRAMRDELARSMAELRLDTLPKPYFVAYRVDDIEAADAAASLGGLVRGTATRTRRLRVELRVGDYEFDNSNFMGMPGPTLSMLSGLRGGALLPLDNQYQEIRRQLWLATDGAYKRAVEQLAQKRAALQNQTRSERLPDFAREPPVVMSDVVSAAPLDTAAATALVRALSATFRAFPEVYSSGVAWSGGVVRTRYLNSEGSAFTRSSPWLVLRIHAATQAVDGMPLADAVAIYAGTPSDLPGREKLIDSVRALATRLTRLRQTPVAEVYNGPVLFEGDAAGELVNQVFAPRLVAARRPMAANPMMERFAARAESPFLDQIGGRVLPTFLSVVDNPTLTRYEGHSIGGYRVDDDAVAARETRLVDHGILQTLLSTRVPVRGIAHSTGNRWGAGAVVSNLVVTVDSEGGVSDQALRADLLKRAAARGRPYAVVVRRLANPASLALSDPMELLAIMGDMGEDADESPALQATVAVKLFPDGHEEPIRNGAVSGVTAASFKDIVAASQSRTVYTSSFHSVGGMFAAFGAGGGGGGMNLQMMSAGLGYAASYVVPSFLFEDVTVKGPSGDRPKPPLSSPPWASPR